MRSVSRVAAEAAQSGETEMKLSAGDIRALGDQIAFALKAEFTLADVKNLLAPQSMPTHQHVVDVICDGIERYFG